MKKKNFINVKHGLCEKCFEHWKESLDKEIKCLFCGIDLAYDKSFLDSKVFILENDLEQMNSNFKEQINEFFREKNIKLLF